MPYTIRKLKDKPYYKVTIRGTGQIVARATPNPQAVIRTIESSKMRAKKK